MQTQRERVGTAQVSRVEVDGHPREGAASVDGRGGEEAAGGTGGGQGGQWARGGACDVELQSGILHERGDEDASHPGEGEDTHLGGL